MNKLLLLSIAVSTLGCAGAPGAETGCDERACADAVAWTFAATGGVARTSALAVDDAGDVFAVGAFDIGIDFGAGPAPAPGSFLLKFGPNGDAAWMLTLPPNVALDAVAFDGQNGQIDVAGVLTGAASIQGEALDPGDGPAPLVAAFDTESGLLWAKTLSASPYVEVHSLAVARDGTIGIGGMQIGDTSIDALLASVDAHGVARFERSYHAKDTGWTQAMVSSVAFDAEGALFATGFSDGDVWFGDVEVSAAAGSLFVAKVEPDGSVAWVYTGPGLNDVGAQLVRSLPSGDMAIAGTYVGSPDFGQGPLTNAQTIQTFVLRMNGQGEVVASTAVVVDAQAEPTGIDVASDGRIAITGTALAGSAEKLADYEMFVAELDPALRPTETRSFHASSSVFSSDVVLDPSGRVILGGQFTGSIDLGDGPRGGHGSSGLFVAKLPR